VDDKIGKKEYDCSDSLSFTAVLDHRGRITIPASVRRKIKIKQKSVILMRIYRRIKNDKEFD